MAYNIRSLLSFEKLFGRLMADDKERITEKVDRLAEHPETIGAPLVHQ